MVTVWFYGVIAVILLSSILYLLCLTVTPHINFKEYFPLVLTLNYLADHLVPFFSASGGWFGERIDLSCSLLRDVCLLTSLEFLRCYTTAPSGLKDAFSKLSPPNDSKVRI